MMVMICNMLEQGDVRLERIIALDDEDDTLNKQDRVIEMDRAEQIGMMTND
jgi:hypothetical protein